VIVVWPTSGLGNRLRVISSFRVLARQANRDFAVCWTASPGWSDEHIGDLFEHDLRLVDERQFNTVAAATALRLDEIVNVEGRLDERTWTWAPGTSFEQIFDTSIPAVTYRGMMRADYLLAPDRRPVLLGDGFTSQYEEDVRTWRPVRRIRKAVDRVTAGFGPNTIGVHIRRGDAWQTEPGSPWRRSTDAAFMAAMDRELEADPGTTFFLATDSPETERWVCERYGSAVLTNTKKRFVPSKWGKPKENQRDAVIDMFALARTKRILASYYSSFSRMAAVIGDVPYRDVVENQRLGVDDHIRLRRRVASASGRPRDTVVSFVLNHTGLGHASRLAAVHDAVRRRTTLQSMAFVEEHTQQLIKDYRIPQIVLPRYPGVFMESKDEPSRNRELAQAVIELSLQDHEPIVLHDVFVHRALYDAAATNGWPQAFIHRDRANVEDPLAWLQATATAVSVMFWIGADGLVQERAGLSAYGIEDIVRIPLGDAPLWKADSADLRVMVTAGGGGRQDAAQFVNAAIAAVDIVSRRREGSVEARVVTGPYYREEVRVPARSPAAYTVSGYVPPTHSLYWGSSVVVAQSGYNTFQELGRIAVPHVLVPSGNFGADDQQRRADSRGDAPDVRVVPCDPAAIADAIEQVVAATRLDAWPAPPEDDGAHQIAAALAVMAESA
jgi:hypothetical protein